MNAQPSVFTGQIPIIELPSMEIEFSDVDFMTPTEHQLIEKLSSDTFANVISGYIRDVCRAANLPCQCDDPAKMGINGKLIVANLDTSKFADANASNTLSDIIDTIEWIVCVETGRDDFFAYLRENPEFLSVEYNSGGYTFTYRNVNGYQYEIVYTEGHYQFKRHTEPTVIHKKNYDVHLTEERAILDFVHANPKFPMFCSKDCVALNAGSAFTTMKSKKKEAPLTSEILYVLSYLPTVSFAQFVELREKFYWLYNTIDIEMLNLKNIFIGYQYGFNSSLTSNFIIWNQQTKKTEYLGFFEFCTVMATRLSAWKLK